VRARNRRIEFFHDGRDEVVDSVPAPCIYGHHSGTGNFRKRIDIDTNSGRCGEIHHRQRHYYP
jgi:hypothetical protein